jgi:hypothetical protein
MIDPAMVQAVLLGSGGFICTTMAGVGAFRLCNSGAKRIAQIPVALASGAEELARLRQAVERDQSMVCLVTEQAGVLKAIRDDIAIVKSEQEQFHRELRIISRKTEGLGYEHSDD